MPAITRKTLEEHCERLARIVRNVLAKGITPPPVLAELHHPEGGWYRPDLPPDVYGNRELICNGMQALIEVSGFDAIVLICDAYMTATNIEQVKAAGLDPLHTTTKEIEAAGLGERTEAIFINGQSAEYLYAIRQPYEREGESIRFGESKATSSKPGDGALLGYYTHFRFPRKEMIH